MYELFNWKDTWILFQFNWFWLALAFALGAFTGFYTCEPVRRRKA